MKERTSMKIIIFDTNAWLDLYMIHPLALKEIILKFQNRQELFWIPEQVYWEFSNHSKEKRESALHIIDNTSNNTRAKTAQIRDHIKSELLNLKNNVILSDERIINEIKHKFDDIQDYIKKELDSINNEYTKSMEIITEEKDIIYNLINEIYTINPPYHLSEVQRIKLYEEGELRIKYGIPPGLTDIDKDSNKEKPVYRRRYGDYLIWNDILRKTKDLAQSISNGEKLQVIFVENEKKGDWWVHRGESTLSPILMEEFESVSCKKAEIEMISFTDFLSKYCKEFDIEKDTVRSLVEKNRYKERVLQEINNTARQIVDDLIHEYYTSSTKQEQFFKRKSYLGGTFHSIDDFQINISEPIGVKLFDDTQQVRLVAKVDLDYSGILTEYINKDQTETAVIKDSCSAIIIIEIFIDYSQGYNDVHYNIGDKYMQSFRKVGRPRMSELKHKVFERDEYTCQICGKTIHDGAELCVDHIIPVGMGGTDDFDNLQTLCTQCNKMKGLSIL